MKLPEVADRLRALAVELKCEELNMLAGEIARRPSGQRPPATSTPITEEVREQIRAMKAANPNISQMEIGRRLNVNSGRVSEALKGKRL